MYRFVLMVAGLLVVGSAGAEAGGGPGLFSQWLTALRQAGYGVTAGSAAVDTLSYCQQVVIPVLGKCNGNDPSDPYVLPLMPFGNGYVDPYYGALGRQTLADGTVVGQIFQLADTQAELVIVNMPPAAAYFSFQNDVYTRLASRYPQGAGQVSLDPARAELRATYGNSTNNVDIARQSGVGFGQGTIAIVVAPNAALQADMVQRFVALGGDPALIFAAPVGANVMTGLGAGADDYNSLVRYLGPKNSVAAQAWLGNVTQNVQVYRIDQPAGLAVSAYPTQALFAKTAYAADESGYAADLAELSNLMAGWLASEGIDPAPTISAFGTSETVSATGVVSGEYGPACIAHGQDCVGDEQDTAAYWNRQLGTVDAGGAFVVVGVNHAVTGNATFTSLAVIDADTNTGVIGVSQTDAQAAGFSAGTLGGSAERALKALGLWAMASPALRQAAPALYVQVFSRGCTALQGYCRQGFTTVISDAAVPYAHSIVVTARAYLLPGAATGADPDFLLPPQGVK